MLYFAISQRKINVCKNPHQLRTDVITSCVVAIAEESK